MAKFAPIEKPYPEFPLTYDYHIGYFKKKVKGKLVRFGPRGDGRQWKAALAVYNRDINYLKADQDPNDYRTPDGGGYQIRDLCNDYLKYMRQRAANGAVEPDTVKDAIRTCDVIVKHLNKSRLVKSLGVPDFNHLRSEIGKNNDGKPASPKTIKNRVCRIKAVFNAAYDNDWIDRPVKYGKQFAPLPKRYERKAKAGSQKISPKTLKAILKGCEDIQMRAMILLGINGGWIAADFGELELSHLSDGWVRQPRSKTGVNRECPLFPETVKAIDAWLKVRKGPTELVFVTKYGNPWNGSGLASEFAKLEGRDGHTFTDLRRSFQTVGDDKLDNIATKFIMGHSNSDMSSLYRQEIFKKRLVNVVSHVRKYYRSALGSRPEPC